MPIADVLMIDSSPTRFDDELVKQEPPLSKQFEVAPGIWLAGVKHDIAEQVMAATGFHTANPRYRTAMYAFVRYDPLVGSGTRMTRSRSLCSCLTS